MNTEAIDWESVGCMLCYHTDNRPAGNVEWRGNVLNYSICLHCGLKYMNPRPTAAWYRDFYASEFWEDKFENRSWRPGQATWMPWHWLRSGFSGRIRKGRKRAKAVTPLIAEHARLQAGARVLDIGCAFGLILDRLRRDFRCEPYGIEPSRVARDYAARSCGVSFIGITAEELPKLSAYDGCFDLVIMSNMLENIVEPRLILEACRRVLKDEGSIYIETPNFFYYDAVNPYHPYIYNEATLSALLAQAGLEVGISIYKASVGVAAPENHIDRVSRVKFITVFAKPGEPTNPIDGDVDVDALLNSQRLSLATL